MEISAVIMKEISNFSDNNNYNISNVTRLSRPIVHTTHYGTEQILEQKYMNWYHKILKKKNLSLVLKKRLRNGYHKIARVVFVRHI